MFIIIDTGGTNTRIVAVATDTTNLTTNLEESVAFPTPADFTAGMEAIVSTIHSLTPSVSAIAMGVPGSVNDAGEIIRAPNLPNWIDKPLAKTLADTFICAVHIRNDAEMGALGEAHFGTNEQTNFVYFAWGTGIGYAEVKYSNDTATVSRPENRDRIHDFETKIGGKKLETRFGKSAKDLSDDEWDMVLADIKIDLPLLAHHYHFDTVVFGGGVAAALCPRLAETLQTVDLNAQLTTLGSQSNLYGAFALLREASTVV